MNLENLSVGQVVKSYKAMCELLGEKYKGGDSKKSQIKKWKRYFSYIEDGNKFIITEIYERPLEKATQERKGIYNDIVQLLILDLLSKNEGNLIITKEKLTKKIGLTNENYSLGYINQSRMSEYLEVDNVILGDFYKVNTASISKILNKSIESLERKFIIDKQDVMMIQYNGDSKPRVATVFDREMIQTINRECLLSLGLSELDIQNRNVNYYKFIELQNQILKQRTQIKYYYTAMDIVFNNKFLAHEMNELTNRILTKLERVDKMKELNSIYANKVIDKADKRQSEARELNETKNELSELLLARFSDIYISSFQKMTNNLIKLDAPPINRNIFFNKNKQGLSDSEVDSIREQLPF